MERKDSFSIVIYVFAAVLLLAFSVISVPMYVKMDNYHSLKIEKSRDISKSFNKLIDDRKKALYALTINKPVVYKLLTGELEADAPTSQCLLGTSRLITEASIVYVMNSEGTVVGSSIDEENISLIGNNYKFRDYFTKAMNGETVIYPAVGVTTMKRGIYISSPVIKEETQEPFGVVVIKIGLEGFEELFSDFHGYIFLVSPEGVVFSCNDNNFLFKTLKQLSPVLSDSLTVSRQYSDKNLEPLSFCIDTTDTEIYGNHYSVEEIPMEVPGWKFIIGFDSDTKAPLTLLQTKLLLWGFLIEAILLTGGLMLLFNIVRRKETEKKLNEERKNLDHKVKERTKELSLANEKFKESLKHFETIFNTSPDITTLTNMQTGRLVNVNQYFTSIVGYKKEEVTDRSVIDLWKDPEHRNEFSKQLKEKGECYNYESEFVCKDGRIINGIVSAKVLDLNGIAHIIAITKDVTGLKEGEKEKERLKIELSHSQKLQSIGTLAAGIAHEINSPLQYTSDNIDFIANSYQDIINLVKTYKNLMMNCHTDQDKENAKTTISGLEQKINLDFLLKEMPDALSQTKDGIARIRKIVNAMKQYSNLNLEEKKATDINKTLENAEIITRNEWKYHAEVRNEFDTVLPFCECYEAELNQVFMNLIVNAAHATKDAVDQKLVEKGIITIKTSHEEGRILISFSDNGTGMSDKIKDKIYDPFFTTKDVGKGTGQGLAIAYKAIVDRHDGKIWFETEQNKGTTFLIEVPV